MGGDDDCDLPTRAEISMMKRILGLFLPLVISLVISTCLLLPASVVVAAVDGANGLSAGNGMFDNGDQVVFGDNFVLGAGESVRGDLSVFGGNAKLEEGSRVYGDVNVLGGNVDVLGSIDGDINVIWGNVNLRASAKVGGKQNVVSGNVSRAPGVTMGAASSSSESKRSGVTVNPPGGGFFNRLGAWLDATLAGDGGPTGFWRNLFQQINRSIGNDPFGLQWLRSTLSSAIFTTLLAVLAMAIFPSRYLNMVWVARQQSVVSLGVGGLTWVAVPILATILVFTICLIPISVIGILAWGLGSALGWVVSAALFGDWLLRGLGKTNIAPIGQTAIGAFALVCLSALPVIGWLLGIGATFLGLGALLLTRFGTRGNDQWLVLRA